MTFKTDLVKRSSVIEAVAVWNKAVADVTTAHNLLETSQKELRRAFVSVNGFSIIAHRNDLPYIPGMKRETDLERLVVKMKGDAWNSIVVKMNLRNLLSEKRIKELDKQIHDEPWTLPDVTEENIFGMLEDTVKKLDTYFEEAVVEVFDMLRPPHSKYKTNTEFAIGRKVILRAFYPDRYGTSHPQVDYNNHTRFRSLDNVFHLLDGQGPVETYNGPLIDAVRETKEFGSIAETAYFKAKVYQNGNIHIEFKRHDLLDKLNRIAGGRRLNK